MSTMVANPVRAEQRSEEKRREVKSSAHSFAKLAASLFPFLRTEEPITQGKTVILTSARAREGVTTVSQKLGEYIARNTDARVALLSLGDLDQLNQIADDDLQSQLAYDPETRLFGASAAVQQKAKEPPAPGRMGGRQARRKAVLESLKGQFDCILLDSPSLQESEDVLGAAPLADGVLMVVASGSSTQHQVVNTAKAISASGGKLEGCCFNRRRYPIPAFLYRLFRR